MIKILNVTTGEIVEVIHEKKLLDTVRDLKKEYGKEYQYSGRDAVVKWWKEYSDEEENYNRIWGDYEAN